MHCTRHDCRDRDRLVTDHGTDPDTGLPTCWKCGDYLSARALPLRHTLAGGAPGSGEPWEGSWGRINGEGPWCLRVYMPDNDHRNGWPVEGDEIRVTTRKGRVALMKLGDQIGKTRTTLSFAAPPRD